MKITKVSFDKTIGMPNYSNDRPGVVEATLEDGDTLESAWTELNKRAIEWHLGAYPHLYQESKTAEGVIAEFTRQSLGIPVISKESERLEIHIDNAQTLDELSTIKDACGKAGLVSEYMKKLNELMTGRPKDFTENLD